MKTDSIESEETGNRYNVPALERGLMLLSQFNRDTKTLSAPALAKRLGIPKSTVFRLLATLERMGFVQRMEGGNHYQLDIGVLRLGFEYLASLELTELGKPVLENLSRKTGLASQLIVRDGQSAVFIAKVAPPTPYSSSVTIGTRLPAHATIIGQMLLAALSFEQLKNLYSEGNLKQYSPNTPSTVQELYKVSQTMFDKGYGISEGQFEQAISTIAAPVLGAEGKIVAAMSVTATSSNFDPSKVDNMREQTIEAAAELSALLHHHHSF